MIKQKRGRNKKAIFFSLDALIALIIILLSITVIYPIIRYSQKESYIPEDIISSLSALKIGDMNSDYVNGPGGLRDQGNITDLNKSVLEQIGEFYISTNPTIKSLANELAKEVLLTINTSENIGIWYDDDLLASSNTTSFEGAKNVNVERQIISGIKEGNATTGYSARAFLTNSVQTKYYYFGGYVGEGNISLNVEYNGSLEKVELEITANKDFRICINDHECEGSFQPANSDFEPKYFNPSYTSYFKPGPNTFKIVPVDGRSNNLHVAGGYLKLTYKDGVQYEQPIKYYFPGIEGLINIYDGFYVPGELNNLSVYLHYKSNYTTFLTIGNETVFNESSDVETSKTISDSELRSKINYNSLVNKTIPLRIGIENFSYTGLAVDIDSVLVTDVSGSMEWCGSSSETSSGNSIWEEDGKVFCGERRYLTTQCSPQKIYSAENAEKAFVSAMLVNNGPRIGIVEYSEGNSVKKVDTDLTAKLYIGANPDCYEKDWHESSYDDSSWGDYFPFLYPSNIDDCDYCRGFFRKKFYVNSISNIKYIKLNLYGDDGNVCFINGKEVGNSTSSGSNTYDIPFSIINEGENFLACSVQDRTGSYRFRAELYTDKGYLIPEPSPAITYAQDSSMVLHYNFNDYHAPAKDSSSFGNNGIVTGATWFSDGSMSFDGNDYIRIPNSNSLQLNTDLTIEFWLNPNGYLGYDRQNPIDKSYSGEFALTLESSSNKGAMSFYQGKSSSYLSWGAFDTGTIKDNEWQHIVITRDASTRTLKSYYNGVLNKTTTYSNSYDPRQTNSDVYIGDGYVNGFRGRIDEAALYNRVLSNSEIQQHYNNYESIRWKKKSVYQCGDSSDPKYIRARKNVETEFVLLATIKNSGTAITTPFSVKFYKNSVSPGNEIGSSTINQLDAWGLESVKINWIATLSLNTRIYVVADNQNVIVESNEGNNQANLMIYVYDFVGKDLDITSFSYSPTICSWQSRDYTLTATVKNIGGVDVTEKFNLTFFRDFISPSNRIGSVEINGLASDDSITKSIIWNAYLTSNTNIIAYADYENYVSEGSETNNDYPISISKTLSDLKASDLSLNESLCSPGFAKRNVTFSIYNYYCPFTNYTRATVSTTPFDYSNSQLIAPSGVGYIYKYFDVPLTIPLIGIPISLYSYVDMYNNVSEANEGNNQLSKSYNVGPDIYFYDSDISIIPNPVQKNVPTDINLSIKIKNTQCSPVTFKFAYYRDSVNPINLIYSETITLTDTNARTVNTTWKDASLSYDTTIYAVIDYNYQVVEYNELNNIKTGLISVQSIGGTGFSIQNVEQLSVFPFYEKNFEFGPLFLKFLGLTNSCAGTNYLLFSPDSNIARNKGLTNNKNELNSFIDKTETWWNTCICCGINKAAKILSSSGSTNKFIIVMSDGEANVKCSEQGTGNAKQDSIQAACDAYNNYKIKVFSVCFGGDCDETTMKLIAKCGNSSYYYSDVNDLVSIYQNIVKELIKISYFEQTANVTGNVSTILYPDSYIEFNYNREKTPYGIVITEEKKFSDNYNGSFDLPLDSGILETRVTSYSGPRWTKEVSINYTVVYNLSKYGNDYTKLGDPYAINIPNYAVGNNNKVRLTTGISPTNTSAGSSFNKIIYTILKNMISYSAISQYSRGCNWTVQFEDNTNLTIEVPAGATDTCYYKQVGGVAAESHSSQDTLQIAVYNLFKKLDLDNNGKLDVKFTEQNLQVSSSEVIGIPFPYETVVQVRKWW